MLDVRSIYDISAQDISAQGHNGRGSGSRGSGITDQGLEAAAERFFVFFFCKKSRYFNTIWIIKSLGLFMIQIFFFPGFGL